MTLFSLAKKNIKLNTKHYLLYFYPMVFSMVIYFTFVSLQYNKQINESATALGKVEPAFLAASVVLLLFSAIFIWYSNDFFIRKRKKEVALYSLFGMRKKQVAQLLFYENFIMGIVALGIGMGIGIFLSKLFTMLLIKLMGFSVIANFEVSAIAIVQTLVVFIVIIIVTSIHNYRMIYRYSLLDLLKAEKLGNDHVGVEKNQAIVFSDGNLNQHNDPYTGKMVTIEDHRFTISKYVDKPVLNQGYYSFPMVINNEDYAQLKEQTIAKEMQVYKVKNEKSMESVMKEIEEIVFQDSNVDRSSMIFSSFFQEYQKGVETYGLLIFIGGFLGIVFLLATGSMLHYKQLTEATMDQGRYDVLRKIGMNRKQIQATIAKQLLPVFLLPMVIAIPNSSFLIVALARFTEMNMLLPFISIIILYLAIYLIYYFITLRKYYSIVERT